MEIWLIIVLIVVGVLVLAGIGFLLWWFVFRKKREDPDRYMTVTCSTCGQQSKIDKYDPPPKIVCSNCGKEGPVKF